MLFEKIKLGVSVDDSYFNSIYPEELTKFASLHFTPIEIAKHVAKFLTSDRPNAKILDMGSGVGKFCMVGSVVTEGFFVGIEQRESLVEISKTIAFNNRLLTTEFIYGNILDINFQNFDAFYIFNSFYENVSFDENITDEINLIQPNYDIYSTFVKQELEKLPVGTKLATYFCSRSIAPDRYQKIENTINDNLHLWIKTQ